ncbi:MAG: type I 3-dehydroquinate dehydratase [Candidatus Micrarchaeota archaeon]
MICISVGEKTVFGCMKALGGTELAEIRLDLLDEKELTPDNVRKLISSGKKVVATCRPGKMADARRLELLSSAIDAGAAYVDIEVEAKDGYKEALVKKAKEKGCEIIISYHDHQRTPSAEELRQMIAWCFDCGADMAKIACMVKSDKENARLLGLLDSDKRLIVVGMGPEGRITRILAPLLGSEFTFASSGEGKETAEGQLDKETVARALGALRKAVGGSGDD